MPNLIRFTRQTPPNSKTPFVTILPRGAMNLSYEAYKLLGQPSHVVLLYDSDRHIIGLQPTHAGDPDAYPVRKAAKGQTRQISIQAFLSHFDISVDKSRRFPVKKDKNTLLIDLKSTSLTAKTSSTKSKSIVQDDVDTGVPA